MTASTLGRREVLYEGQVQGVGFRYTTHRIANDFCINGYVQNLPLGQVKLVVEGEIEEITTFLSQIDTVLGVYIQHQEHTQTVATKEFTGFNIRS